jgi:hypothetical protein
MTFTLASTSPVWCWLSGLIAAVLVEAFDGDPLRVVAAGLIAYGITLFWQSTV